MKGEVAFIAGVLVGIPVGVLLGWLLANFAAAGKTALVLSRKKETGEIEAIIPVRVS